MTVRLSHFPGVVIAAVLALAPFPAPLAATPQQPRIEVGFSPGAAEALVVRTIDSAHATIEVAAYSFTSRPVAAALLRAKARGVAVRIVADKSQRTARYTSIRFLARQGVPVRVDDRYSIMHNKFLVVDGRAVETGSFNYTRAAQLRNAENVIVVEGAPAVAAAYANEWRRLWAESAPYDGRE